MKKEIITKITVTIIAVILICICIVFSRKKEVSDDDGIINFVVENVNRTIVIDEEINFSKGDNLLDLLKRNHKIVVDEDIYVTILQIDDISSNPSSNLWFMILVNDEYASVGITQIQLVDKMKVTLRLEQF